MRHTISETLSGIRRNFSMTLAVIVTMWVSLSLFGAGLLAAQQVDLLKDRWYDKIEISVFLCVKDVPGDMCDPGQDATQAQKNAIEATLRANPEVETVYYESKQEAYDDYRRTYADSPLLDSLTVDQMQDSFRIKLVDPENYQGVVAEAASLPGVQNVLDLHAVLDPIFAALNGLKWGTMGMAALLLLAAMLQIGNTIRMSAFTRRREIGIMRLVGASNVYIMLPFLLDTPNVLDNGDYVYLPGIRKALLEAADEMIAVAVKPDGGLVEFRVRLGAMTDAERQILADGCLINYYKNH